MRLLLLLAVVPGLWVSRAGALDGIGSSPLRSVALAGAVRSLDSGPVPALPQGPCLAESRYEGPVGSEPDPYGPACRRLRFAVGPFQVGPGRNEATLLPFLAPRPLEDGYVVRYTMDLVDQGPDTSDRHPPANAVVDRPVHLHHAAIVESSGFDSPERHARVHTPLRSLEFPTVFMIVSGEERTVVRFPTGYGLSVDGNDAWSLEHMIMNPSTVPRSVLVTYDIDYVVERDARRLGIVEVEPIWLDVQNGAVHPESDDHFANPVFNVQKGFGHLDDQTGRRVCAFPRENCARHDPWGEASPNQGKTVDREGDPIAIPGKDIPILAHHAGTLVFLAGHLHPGGLRTEVSLVRDGAEQPIFYSDAVYWRTDRPEAAGGEVGTWDFAMTASGADLGWKVKIETGDALRINAVYDAERASWYSGMGIVMAFVAPDDPHGTPGIDVFDDPVVLDEGPAVGGVYPEGLTPSCRPDLTSAAKRLCLRGSVTRGPQGSPAHGHGGGGAVGGTPGEIPGRDVGPGPRVSEISLQDFTFGTADHRTTERAGIPRVVLGETVRFVNLDTTARLWHTVTRCSEPCTGPGTPLADAGNGDLGDTMDFDSGEIGYGTFLDSAKSVVGADADVPGERWVKDGAVWELSLERTGMFTFFCRSHPWMRGVFEVVEPAGP